MHAKHRIKAHDGNTGILKAYSPQILRGASSSRRMGWLKKISLDFIHSPRISASVSWTFFPGLEPRTERQETALKLSSDNF